MLIFALPSVISALLSEILFAKKIPQSFYCKMTLLLKNLAIMVVFAF
jgi:hypothetical protein